MKTMVDFVMEMPADRSLAEEARKMISDMVSAENLKNWFYSKGYSVSDKECEGFLNKKISDALKKLEPSY